MPDDSDDPSDRETRPEPEFKETTMSCKFARHTRVISVALATPAVRMVCIAAYHTPSAETGEPEGVFHEVAPVLALRSTAQVEYRRAMARGGVGLDVTHEELVAAGWRPSLQWVRHDALVLDTDSGEVVDTVEHFGGCDHCEWVLELAPWPPEEDEARLAAAIRELEAAAESRVRHAC
jgi:hypothetical protein